MPWSDTTGARIDPPGRHLRRQKAKSAGDRRAPTRQTGWLTALKALFAPTTLPPHPDCQRCQAEGGECAECEIERQW